MLSDAFPPNMVKFPENCVTAVSGDCRTFALVNSCEDAFPSRARLPVAFHARHSSNKFLETLWEQATKGRADSALAYSHLCKLNKTWKLYQLSAVPTR